MTAPKIHQLPTATAFKVIDRAKRKRALDQQEKKPSRVIKLIVVNRRNLELEKQSQLLRLARELEEMGL